MMMPTVDIVKPDSSVYGGVLFDIAGSFLGFALIACTAGIFISAGVWAISRACDAPQVASSAKQGLVGCTAGAFVSAGLWATITWIISVF